VGGFAALRTVGFEPLAPVTGTAVFSPPLGYDVCWNGPRRKPVVDEVAEQFERDTRRLALERMRRPEPRHELEARAMTLDPAEVGDEHTIATPQLVLGLD
jgi:hypothetical protein